MLIVGRVGLLSGSSDVMNTIRSQVILVILVMLVVPPTRNEFGDRSVSAVSPGLWTTFHLDYGRPDWSFPTSADGNFRR